MKKKILSTLLAVCLFVGAAIPSVFAGYTSDLAGNAQKVTKITVLKEKYDIKEGDKVDFAEEISVYETKSKLVVDLQQIRYEAKGDTNFFNITTDGVVTAVKTGGTITLTIYDDQNKSARVDTIVNSIPGTGVNGNYATSFKFDTASRYDAVYDNVDTYKKDKVYYTVHAENFNFSVESIPSGTMFNNVNEQNIIDKVVKEMNAKLGLTNLIGQQIYGGANNSTKATVAIEINKLLNNGIATNAVFSIGGISIVGTATTNANRLTSLNAIKDAIKGKTLIFGGENFKYVPAKTSNSRLFFEAETASTTPLTEADVAAAVSNAGTTLGTDSAVVVSTTTGTGPSISMAVETTKGADAAGGGGAGAAAVSAVYDADLTGMTAGTVITKIMGFSVFVPFDTNISTTVGKVVDALNASAAVSNDFTASVNGNKVKITAKTPALDVGASSHIVNTEFTTSLLYSIVVDLRNFLAGGIANGAAFTIGTANLRGTADSAKNLAGAMKLVYDSFSGKTTTIDGIAYTMIVNTAGTVDLFCITNVVKTAAELQSKAAASVLNNGVPIANNVNVIEIKDGSNSTNGYYKGVVAKDIVTGDKTSIAFTVDADEMQVPMGAMAFNKNVAAEFKYQMIRQDGSNGLNVTAKTTLNAVKAIPVQKVGFMTNDTVKVGEFKTYEVTYYPTNANVGKATNVDFAAYRRSDLNNVAKYEHAVVTKKSDAGKVTIRGIDSSVDAGKTNAVTTIRATVTTSTDETTTHDAVVTVVDQDFTTATLRTPYLNTTTGAIKVGGEMVLSVKDAVAGTTIKWSIDNANASIEPYQGITTKIRGKKVGTCKVTAKLSTGETFTTTVTVAAK